MRKLLNTLLEFLIFFSTHYENSLESPNKKQTLEHLQKDGFFSYIPTFFHAFFKSTNDSLKKSVKQYLEKEYFFLLLARS
jgi:hypothetical protein